MSILTQLPDSWKTSVILTRSAGRDDDGNVQPSTVETLNGCLLAPKGSNDPVDRSSYIEGAAILYAPAGTVVDSTDRIQSPEGSIMPGKWAVDGNPIYWPFGVEIPLRKEG